MKPKQQTKFSNSTTLNDYIPWLYGYYAWNSRIIPQLKINHRGILTAPCLPMCTFLRDCCLFLRVNLNRLYCPFMEMFATDVFSLDCSHSFCCCFSSYSLRFSLNSYAQTGVIFQLETWRQPPSHKIAHSNHNTYTKDLFLENWCNSPCSFFSSVSKTHCLSVFYLLWWSNKPN